MSEIAAAADPGPGPADHDASALALGARIRALRKRRGLTLTQAASDADLSHSFLSQVERGHERLSMASLFRIARALGTTQQALLTDEPEGVPSGGFHVYRATSDSPVDAGSGSGAVTVLAQQRARFLPMIFSGSFEDDGLWWQHDEEEFVYVLEGEIVIVLEDEEVTLARGDAAYYGGGSRHKWRTAPGETCQVLVVKEQQHHT
ncbi:transcriptional regulator with XRE-family HTH domain [Microbacterium endophyticum]|uniref:Transcriptional regulator with XRE-family HTH domain n=1 Tax=Microbacterium endophyticum TaxID=1526412 RepID=A0A7W4V2U1_9MICO|nr:XRE family transcriptional regulator [Microbacterium endophyticum]MBB2975674.1 transcriptional regulator with XRE-family HTH domain [Microbacterium endophyticum]NIK35307.1 transcriptional regulator with XRE-family HTH domain [Microbacterium endophyticum]